MVRTLDELRAAIDALDLSLLDLLSQRMALVAEVAQVKREGGRRIRDLVRERAVLESRVDRGRALGLPREMIEPLFRLVLLASRERQAALRVEMPLAVAPRRVAIVGGHGGMGRLFGELFASLGHEVTIADLDTDLTPEAAARDADVVLVSVPIDATEEVLRRVGPELREDALLLDVTSLKVAPMRTMLACTRASVVGTHPMFGPSVGTLQGQRIVVCRGRGDVWGDWLEANFRARGLVVVRSTAEQHDRAMGVVQVLNHFQTEVLGLTLARLGTPLDETFGYSSPAYLLETYVTARHFAQAPELYGPILMENLRRDEVTSAFVGAARELQAILATQDRARFAGVFEEVRGFFGDFTREALEQSRHLLDRLVELSAGREETHVEERP